MKEHHPTIALLLRIEAARTPDQLASLATEAVKAGLWCLAEEAIDRMAPLDWDRAEAAMQRWCKMFDRWQLQEAA